MEGGGGAHSASLLASPGHVEGDAPLALGIKEDLIEFRHANHCGHDGKGEISRDLRDVRGGGVVDDTTEIVKDTKAWHRWRRALHVWIPKVWLAHVPRTSDPGKLGGLRRREGGAGRLPLERRQLTAQRLVLLQQRIDGRGGRTD